ncbi:hypothetical protein [Neisseria shayeganii]|uniref:hypothetical protein n=1 Tax=Neisseria shayeganii TaxID=607712 RepID=UPI001FD4D7E4|nr:hypothetical protein [Neisseria shayeganii]
MIASTSSNEMPIKDFGVANIPAALGIAALKFFRPFGWYWKRSNNIRMRKCLLPAIRWAAAWLPENRHCSSIRKFISIFVKFPHQHPALTLKSDQSRKQSRYGNRLPLRLSPTSPSIAHIFFLFRQIISGKY